MFDAAVFYRAKPMLSSDLLQIIVHAEFHRRRHVGVFAHVCPLVFQPYFDETFRENSAFCKKSVILFQFVESFIQSLRKALYLFFFLIAQCRLKSYGPYPSATGSILFFIPSHPAIRMAAKA